MISRITVFFSSMSFRKVLLAVAVSVAALMPTTELYAQSSGLKLGQPAEPKNTLDLGAKPAEQSAPPSPQAPASSGDVASQPAAGPARTTYGAWEVACGPDGKNCAMAQIGNDASGTPVLEMVVRKLQEPLEVGERTAIAVLDVITPLGVVLTEGLAVKIDGGREESAPFQICTEQGCLVREPIDNELVARLKRGNNAVVSVIAANQGEVSANLSLSGFTKAFGALK
ncbi:MAG: invasion associated locus B family protein [Granulosicoccus sp.]